MDPCIYVHFVYDIWVQLPQNGNLLPLCPLSPAFPRSQRPYNLNVCHGGCPALCCLTSIDIYYLPAGLPGFLLHWLTNGPSGMIACIPDAYGSQWSVRRLVPLSRPAPAARPFSRPPSAWASCYIQKKEPGGLRDGLPPLTLPQALRPLDDREPAGCLPAAHPGDYLQRLFHRLGCFPPQVVIWPTLTSFESMLKCYLPNNSYLDLDLHWQSQCLMLSERGQTQKLTYYDFEYMKLPEQENP